jgi:hypothetical protein
MVYFVLGESEGWYLFFTKYHGLSTELLKVE